MMACGFVLYYKSNLDNMWLCLITPSPHKLLKIWYLLKTYLFDVTVVLVEYKSGVIKGQVIL